MRAVVQRVRKATITSEGQRLGHIGPGLLILLAVTHTDTTEVATTLATKIAKLRIFADSAGKMNLDVAAAGGSLLVVSQFTLYADLRRGNQPGFGAAAQPELASARYSEFVDNLRQRDLEVASGRFGAAMQVALVNDGPVTIVIDSEVPAVGRPD